MTDVEPVVSDFAATGRTGRRNALPDILGSTAGPGAADLPDKLAELSAKYGKINENNDWISLDISNRNGCIKLIKSDQLFYYLSVLEVMYRTKICITISTKLLCSNYV
uniref:Uncharacterized protein n=1 Tax=Cyprinus carpio carpio TaxID=630221 RepID=A0A8C1D6M4_CYPCA